MTLHRLFLLLILLLLAAAAFAAEPVRFQVESIEVSGGGARIQSIVIAQSLLREGQTYSEAELADAVSRIRRLPFVRAVSFSLAKGSERGLYRLVITVDPMMSLFFDAQARSVGGDHQSQTFNFGALTVGGRIPVGSSGMARATVSMSEDFDHLFGDSDLPRSKPTFALGYSLYRIGSRAIFADVALFGREEDPPISFPDDTLRFGTALGANVIVGVPVHGNQSVRAEWALYRTPITVQSSTGTEDAATTSNSAQLFWLRDTTDDPLYPLHGSLVKAGAVGTKGRSVGYGPVIGISKQDYTSYGGQVSASQYWSLANEQTVSLHGSYQHGVLDFEDSVFDSSNDFSQLGIGAGFTKRLSGRATDAWIDFRVDGTRYNDSSYSDQLRGRVELAHRSKWGVARLGIEYTAARN